MLAHYILKHFRDMISLSSPPSWEKVKWVMGIAEAYCALKATTKYHVASVRSCCLEAGRAWERIGHRSHCVYLPKEAWLQRWMGAGLQPKPHTPNPIGGTLREGDSGGLLRDSLNKDVQQKTFCRLSIHPNEKNWITEVTRENNIPRIQLPAFHTLDSAQLTSYRLMNWQSSTFCYLGGSEK